MKIKFVPQDFWLGLYWKTETSWEQVGELSVAEMHDALYSTRTYYLCLIPCFPIIWQRRLLPKLWKQQSQMGGETK